MTNHKTDAVQRVVRHMNKVLLFTILVRHFAIRSASFAMTILSTSYFSFRFLLLFFFGASHFANRIFAETKLIHELYFNLTLS